MILVYVTCKNKAEAKKITKHLLEKKLVACGNILESSSIYRWEGKLEDTKEAVLLLKTLDKNYSKIKAEIKKMHSYDVPCILKLGAKANPLYLNWVKKEVI